MRKLRVRKRFTDCSKRAEYVYKYWRRELNVRISFRNLTVNFSFRTLNVNFTFRLLIVRFHIISMWTPLTRNRGRGIVVSATCERPEKDGRSRAWVRIPGEPTRGAFSNEIIKFEIFIAEATFA